MTFYANKIEQRVNGVSFFAEGEHRYALNPQVSCMVYRDHVQSKVWSLLCHTSHTCVTIGHSEMLLKWAEHRN